jgi:hypothetical protein
MPAVGAYARPLAVRSRKAAAAIPRVDSRPRVLVVRVKKALLAVRRMSSKLAGSRRGSARVGAAVAFPVAASAPAAGIRRRRSRQSLGATVRNAEQRPEVRLKPDTTYAHVCGRSHARRRAGRDRDFNRRGLPERVRHLTRPLGHRYELLEQLAVGTDRFDRQCE